MTKSPDTYYNGNIGKGKGKNVNYTILCIIMHKNDYLCLDMAL